MSRSRCFSFTINNYTESDVQLVEDLAKDAVYLVYGREKGKSGTPHLQGYVYYAAARTFRAVRGDLPRAHVEISKAGSLSNSDYCKKDGDYKEFGVRPRQGQRRDLVDVASMPTMREVVASGANYQAIRAHELRLVYLEPVRDFKPRVIWFYGSTGVGKTRGVYELHEEVYQPKSFKWWQRYDGHDVVLIDEFRGDWCKFHELLSLLDRYPYQVECKGSSRQLRAHYMYITSCYHPASVYQGRTDEDIAQLTRRIDHICYVRVVDGNQVYDIMK